MRRVIALCGVLVLAACGEPLDGETVAFETLAQGSGYEPGCAEGPDDRLIRDEAAWASYWTQVHPGAAPARPAVDFASQSVLASCGQRPSPGYAYEITDVQVAVDAPVAAVTVTDREPGPNCVHPAVVVYSHHAVRIDAVVDAADFAHEALAGPPC